MSFSESIVDTAFGELKSDLNLVEKECHYFFDVALISFAPYPWRHLENRIREYIFHPAAGIKLGDASVLSC